VTAEHAGIQKLKRFHMVNIKTKFPRGIEAGLSVEVSKALCEISMTSNCLESDQAISKEATDGFETSVRSDPGLKRQASSNKLREIQASSGKHQALRCKVQAPSRKRQAPGPWILEKVLGYSDQGPLPR
jgi:hypothetical protein